MQHCEPITGANPPADPERHHFDLLAPGDIKSLHSLPVAGHEPLRPELHRVLPHLRVPPHLRHHEIHRPGLRHHVPSNLRVLRHPVRQHEMPRRVSPETLQNHRLQVRQFLQVLLSHLLRFRICSHQIINFSVELVLDFWIFHQIRHDPLQRRRGGVGAGVEKLRAEAHDLGFAQLPLLLRELQIQQSINIRENKLVSSAGAGGGFHSLPGSNQRHEHVFLTLTKLVQLSPPTPEHDFANRRPEIEDIESAETEEQSALDGFDFSDLFLIKLVPKTHKHQQTKHSVLKIIHNPNRLTSPRRRLEPAEKNLEDPFPSPRVRPDPSAITAACPNLHELLAACTFDPRYLGFVGDEDLLSIAANCPKLRLLHLADTSALSSTRGNPDDEGFAAEDARISRATIVEFAAALPLLEELTLDVCKNVRESGLALEELNLKCPKLRSVKLGQFHGICAAVGWQLDGIARCHGLEALSIKNSADLTDMGLIAIARGCSRLAKFEVEGCKKITRKGLRTMASLLHRTLVDVKISCCKNLDAASSLRALEPVSHRIEHLHIDCVWDGVEEDSEVSNGGTLLDINLNELAAETGVSSQNADFVNFENTEYEYESKKKKLKYDTDDDGAYTNGNGNGNGNGFWCRTWNKLRCLSLWIGVGELLIPLAMAGLEDCPNLEEIRIRVDGDCRGRRIPAEPAFGLSSLARYPCLTKMQLDCRDVIGYALTAPSGQMDLSLWERFYLNGIGRLRLTELDYWPPQDRDVNQRTLSLPAAGLLAQCDTLRKLFIHGTAHEHFMMFLLRITYLRDVQLREDYYPAPENDMSTEMRVGSCSRFEDALNSRPIRD